jgi:pyruvate formate lyase activating enzyme
VDNNLEYRKIRSIRRVKKHQTVYNFNVPGYESYVANGFVVHNCENHKISQINPPKNSKVIDPCLLASIAEEKHCQSVTMSYNEPTLSYEYLMELGGYCYVVGLKFAIKTNAFVNRDPWQEVCLVTSAMNIDWKGGSGRFEEVARVNSFVLKDRIKEAYDLGVHIEISLPLFYHKDEVEDQIHMAGEFLSSIDKSIPCHLLRISPSHDKSDFIFDPSCLEVSQNILSKYMDNIYSVI